MNIIRYYNQNRKKILRILVIIIAIFILLKVLNYFTITNVGKKSNNNNLNVNNNVTTTTNSTYSSTTSGVTGSSVGKSTLTKAQDVLDKFYDACNNQNIEEAYAMLTDECKELVYPNLEIFTSNYYNNVFNGVTKAYSFQNWYDNTYYVTIKEDALSTGKVTSNENAKYDYVTIVDDKLNISTYIGRNDVNKEANDKDISMKINKKDTFMDYEIYYLTIKNNSSKIICLTLGDSTDEVYIQDSNDVKYGVYNHEIIKDEMIIDPGYTKNISFKFYSSYISTKKIENMVFKNLILDYEDYKNEANSNNVYEYYFNF